MKKSELRQIIREEIRKVINEVQVGPYTNAISAGNLKPGMDVSLIGVRDELEHIGIIQGIKPKVTKGQYGDFYEYTIEYKKYGEESTQKREFIQGDFFIKNIDFNQKKTLQLVQGAYDDTVTYEVPLLTPISDREFIRQILQTYHGKRERVGDIEIDGNNVKYDVSWSIGD